MLESLHVKNMALIREEEIEFGPGLNILTGETGAGKSIVIGSVSAALGSSSFKDFVPEGADYALVEMIFQSSTPEVKKIIEREGLPWEDGQVVISRRYKGGRAVSRINGETVPISVVKELSSHLIDIHGQHEHQSLLYPKFHLALVDSFAGKDVADLKRDAAAVWKDYRAVCRELDGAVSDEKERLKEIDFLSFEIKEIDGAALREGEDDELEQEFRKLSHASKIQESLAMVESNLDSEGGALNQVSNAVRSLSGIASLDPQLQSLYEELSQNEGLLNDFVRELAGYMDDFQYDEQAFNEIGSRLDTINRLKAKYGRTIADILAYRDKKAKELEKLTDYDAWTAKLRSRKEALHKKLVSLFAVLTEKRRAAADILEKKITQSLIDLNFLDVRFQIAIEPLKEMTVEGADSVGFLISTNPGMPLRPLAETASGGELSRIMLGIKTVMASRDEIETLIFDEIDTGISGRTAQKVSEKMAELSRERQVICITHLAQIASMADQHFLIEKGVADGKTHTGIRLLTGGEEETEELSRILGGAEITDTVRASAREMKALADKFKAQAGK